MLKGINISLLTAYLLSSLSSITHATAVDHTLRPRTSISANPVAISSSAGSGALQKYLEDKRGITNISGIHYDGAWVADTNGLISGGIPDAKKWTSNNLFVFNFAIDTQKMLGWTGGWFDIEFLQFNGQAVNRQAGALQGYNSLPAAEPFNRSELYQIWYKQDLFDNKLILRIGKLVPTLDFSNVVKPVPLNNDKITIPAVTGLIFTPIFVNSSMLGVLPGYYNSIYGITLNFAPIKQWYLSYGIYNGSMAQGIQTGEEAAPNFNGTYFHIAETGVAWLLGKYQKPGNFALGAWHQDGLIKASPTLYQQSASGIYLFGTQRLWYKNPDVNNSGISSFYQYGVNNSTVLPFRRYAGAGLTAFGLIPKRLDDSFGVGAALSWLNQTSFHRATELMYQAYYQAKVMKDIYLEPALSYIPTPGANSSLNPAWAGTLRLIVLY